MRVSLVLLALAASGTAAAQERIAYEADGDIWTVTSTGTEPVNLTAHPAIDAHPDWSPDGTRIVFVSNRSDVPGNADGNLEVFTMLADGTEVQQVTFTEYPFAGQAGYDHYHPTWSPDGTRIAYEWYGPTGSNEIYVADADGSNELLLTDPLDYASKHNPDWSPDGGSLVYTWGFGYNAGQDVHVIAADGTGETSLTPDTAWTDERNPQWSPDGTQIVFETNRDPGNGWFPNDEIYLMNADGSGLLRLTYNDAFDVTPSWSPDGLFVTFSSTRGGAYDLYTIPVTGEPPPEEEPIEEEPVDEEPIEEPVDEEPPAGARMMMVAAAPADGATQITAGAEAVDPDWGVEGTLPAKLTLDVRRGGKGKGTVFSDVSGIRCGADCAEGYSEGLVVTLYAKPKAGDTFGGWKGAACAGAVGATCEVTMDQAHLVGAIFNP